MSGLLQNTVGNDELATLLMPITNKQLVLPNVTVAEIIPYLEPEVVADKPSWYLGNLLWRNQLVPLVCFEEINGEAYIEEQGRQRRIAVLNGLVDGEKLPFCAIGISGVPRLMRVLPNEVVSHDDRVSGPAELSAVYISGEEAVIPNIDWLQEKVLEVL